MTAFFTAAPSYCSRFGVAILLAALADFLFYGQPAGITVLLFAIVIAAAVVAVHPAAFSDGRALIVFNILFALQTALPDGLSYASYAHRGAYPLVVTALLAAGFILAALRPGSETSADPLVRRLVYAWVAQNIMLVVSSILRLDLYIGIYALTYWRVAAFAWMGLVAVGP